MNASSAASLKTGPWVVWSPPGWLLVGADHRAPIASTLSPEMSGHPKVAGSSPAPGTMSS